jgi:hypothetical protein
MLNVLKCVHAMYVNLRKLSVKAPHVPMNMVIGIHTVAQFVKDVAVWLGKSEEEVKRFTSHSLRRTAATIAAAKGMTLPLMKVSVSCRCIFISSMYVTKSKQKLPCICLKQIAGGWSSDKSAEGYVNESPAMKRSIGRALEIGGSENRDGVYEGPFRKQVVRPFTVATASADQMVRPFAGANASADLPIPITSPLSNVGQGTGDGGATYSFSNMQNCNFSLPANFNYEVRRRNEGNPDERLVLKLSHQLRNGGNV